MAFQRSTVFFKATFVLLASTSYRSSAAELPPAGRMAQAFVGPDGTLAQAGVGPTTATVAVDAQGRSAPADAPAVLAVGDRQFSQPAPYPAPAYSPYPVAAAPYPAHAPAPYPAPYPATAPAPHPAGPPCLIPMWSDEDYVCKEYEDWEKKGSWMDSLHRLRIEMADGTKCTVKPPGKWGFWMGSTVTEMTCKAGVWVDGKGKPVTAIEMKTAQWFMITSIVGAVITVWLVYKMFYDTEHWLFAWRLDTARKWGFAAPAPVEDAAPQQDQQGPQGAINISISNASGVAAPEAPPK